MSRYTRRTKWSAAVTVLYICAMIFREAQSVDSFPDAAKSVGTKEKLRHSPGHYYDYRHEHASIIGNPQSYCGMAITSSRQRHRDGYVFFTVISLANG